MLYINKLIKFSLMALTAFASHTMLAQTQKADTLLSNRVGIGTTVPTWPLQVEGTTFGGIRLGTTGAANLLDIWSGTGESRLQGRGSRPMTFYTNDVEHVRISATGNVGIGNTTPSDKLSVSGNVIGGAFTSYIGSSANTSTGFSIGNSWNWFSGTDVGGVMYLQSQATNSTKTYLAFYNKTLAIGTITADTGNSNALEMVGNYGLAFDAGGNTANTSDMFITTAGDVGIGTTAPAGKLDVASGYSYFAGLRLSGADPGNTIYQSVAASNLSISTASGDVILKPAGSSVLTATTTGNVGIGTTTPAAKLEVTGVVHDKIVVRAGSDAAGDRSHIKFVNNSGTLTGFVGSGVGGGLFLVNQIGAGILVDNASNVGIGTNAPAAKLDVVGNIAYPGSSYNIKGKDGYSSFGSFQSSSDAFIGSCVEVNPSAPGVLKTDASLGSMITLQQTDGIRFHTNLTGAAATAIARTAGEVMRITHTGNVGIGTTTPTSKLQVVGIPAYASDAAAGAAGLTAGAFWQTSGHATLPNGVLMVKQ